MTKTVALFIDALSDQYITPKATPTLHDWKEQNRMCRLAPLFAFQGVAASMFSGVPPARTGIWVDFRIDRNGARRRPDPLYRLLHLTPDGIARKVLVTLYERYVQRSHVTPHRVPAHLRHFYTPAIHRSLSAPGGVPGYSTVFDVHRGAGHDVRVVGLSGGLQEKLIRRMERISSGPADFIVLKINLLDGLGHRDGPGSDSVREALRRIDAAIGKAVARNPGKRFLVFSDHGMTPTESVVDVRREIAEAAPDLREGRDFVPFYNSTCVLFRWLRSEAADELRSALKHRANLSFLTKAECQRLAIGDAVSAYADDVLVTSRGNVISPDFYTTKARAGMHGYATTEGERGVALSPTEVLRPTGTMWDLAPTLLELAKLPSPSTFEGRSLLG